MIHWRQIQKSNFTRLESLADFLELDAHNRSQLLERPRFALNVPYRLAEKMAKNDLSDPLFLQFVPLEKEKVDSFGFCADPVGDIAARKTPRLLQKYKGRALLLCTSSCAMHCRFCFRQHFPYESKEKLFEDELQLIAADPSLQEIILSGGDPLSLSDETLASLLTRLSAIPHIKRIRTHTRFPIGIPERIDDSFVSLLASIKTQQLFVLHINHYRELDPPLIERLKKLQKLGIPLLSQTVLLKGVNDKLPILQTLFETLVNAGILPYYLHQFDRVQGLAHFEVEKKRGRSLIRKLKDHLPGYAIPRYVQEVEGAPSKGAIA